MLTLKQKFYLVNKFKRKISFLVKGLSSSAGRTRFGTISIRHRGGGVKKNYRVIDWFRALWNISAVVRRFEYDPFRNTLIMLLSYSCGALSYIIAVENLMIGDIVWNSLKTTMRVGNNCCLKYLKVGLKIHALESNIYKGAQLLRASGAYGKIVKKNYSKILIKLKSGRLINTHKFCTATVGGVLNFNFLLFRYKKAGFMRLKGYRPHVRGVAMNPIDHPHGGGEGKKSKKKKNLYEYLR